MRRVALLLLLAGCRRGPPAPAETAAPASAAPTSPASVAGAPAPPAAPPRLAGCDLRWGLHGTVAGQEVFVRLQRTGETVSGRYFYAKNGAGIPLAGTLAAPGRIELVEGEPDKPTGRFQGTCAAPGGTIEGTWSNGKRSHPFHLDPVVARETPLVAERRLALTRRVKKRGVTGMTECSYRQSLFEIYGAGTPEAEMAINRQPIADPVGPIFGPDAYDAARGCETYVSAEYTNAVLGTFRGLLTVGGGGTSMYEGAPHPNNGDGFHRETYDLTTGKPVIAADLYARFPKALVDRCVGTHLSNLSMGDDAEGLRSYFDGENSFHLTPKGVRVYGAGFPHVFGAFTGGGPTLTWAALLREGALRGDSPIKRAWEGVKPAAPGDAECLEEDP
jgi:hypothetical protein